MDSIFGVGLPELILILILAGVVMGPERIVIAARWLGRTTGQLQEISRSFVRQLNAEVDGLDPQGDLKETLAELTQLRRQVDDLRAEFLGVAASTSGQVQRAVEPVEDDAIGSIAPPHLTTGQLPTGNGRAAVYPLPRLLESPPEPNGNPTATSPDKLPTRLTTADDPE